MQGDTSKFINKTNLDYIAWCQSFYDPTALDDRGMKSLHGLWAWQEQERRMNELRAVLEPFVVHNSSEPTITITVKTEDVTRARAALARSGS